MQTGNKGMPSPRFKKKRFPRWSICSIVSLPAVCTLSPYSRLRPLTRLLSRACETFKHVLNINSASRVHSIYSEVPTPNYVGKHKGRFQGTSTVYITCYTYLCRIFPRHGGTEARPVGAYVTIFPAPVGALRLFHVCTCDLHCSSKSSPSTRQLRRTNAQFMAHLPAVASAIN